MTNVHTFICWPEDIKKRLLEDPFYSRGFFLKQLCSWFCTLNVSAQGKMNLIA